MIQKFDIPNNLSEVEIDMEFNKANKIWHGFVEPVNGDILILIGFRGPEYKFVYYINCWFKF